MIKHDETNKSKLCQKSKGEKFGQEKAEYWVALR